jgi:hypothetical protein
MWIDPCPPGWMPTLLRVFGRSMELQVAPPSGDRKRPARRPELTIAA